MAEFNEISVGELMGITVPSDFENFADEVELETEPPVVRRSSVGMHMVGGLCFCCVYSLQQKWPPPAGQKFLIGDHLRIFLKSVLKADIETEPKVEALISLCDGEHLENVLEVFRRKLSN